MGGSTWVQDDATAGLSHILSGCGLETCQICRHAKINACSTPHVDMRFMAGLGGMLSGVSLCHQVQLVAERGTDKLLACTPTSIRLECQKQCQDIARAFSQNYIRMNIYLCIVGIIFYSH